MLDLSVEIAGIKMQNPVMNASGTFEPEVYKDLIDLGKLGAIVTKSVTLKPKVGNPQPRIYEVVAGMINRIGLKNVGVRKFVAEKLPALHLLKPIHVPLIVSVAGESIEEYLKTAIILDTESKGRIAGMEINVSCPNIEKGLIFGSDPELLFELIATLKRRVSLPLIVKLTPNVDDIGKTAKAAVAGGADAISLINTVKAKARIRGGPYDGEWIEGGLSGPAIKPIAIKKVEGVAKVVGMSIIGMGGICNAEDALDFLRVGASAIAVGTATFRDPLTMIKIADGLSQYLTEKKYTNIAELRNKEQIRNSK